MKTPKTALASLLPAALAVALAQAAPRVDVDRLDYGLSARALAPGVWVVEGANADFSPANGCNIINTGFIATGKGVLVINTGPSRRYGEQLRALIAKTTSEPVAQVIHLNLHPDYFLGNQAFADVPRLATDTTRAGMAREAKSYEDNLYRLCGDWMRGTEALLPSATAAPGTLRLGERELELREYRGHTDSDLVLIDKASGVVFAGGLVFAQRVPTTPHAQPAVWLQSLREFGGLPLKTLVPSHGPVRADASAVAETQRYLQWLDSSFRTLAEQGAEMNEVLRAEAPAEFRGWAAFGTEYTRNVAHLYPRYEQAVLKAAKP
ncbi:quinoprotein relay system zinc metallohydrolase 1 [Piscinibacter sp.]|uniref:quinoprotein relay system zinc metallohydrolase 1 n=1 Tax=Piscinibacter sp. TaxID=1903157 RepID=UPI0039E30425